MTKIRKFQIENTPLFVTVFILFLLSFGLIVAGALKKSNVDENTTQTELDQKNISTEEASLEKYFETSDDVTYEANDPYIKNDPFAQMCAPVSGDGIPSVHSYTVCLR